ncbi:MAG: GAF domain-containing protein [Terriglobales bacterium]
MAIATGPGKLHEVRQAIDQLNSKAASADEFMKNLTLLLQEKMLKYNWVGFYMLEPGAQPPVLVLGHFQGAMTPHTRIHLHQGICGAAASSGKTVVVDDVSKDPRYLSCSVETKSEIVVPVFVEGVVVGELDIDSHFPAAFGAPDQELVEYCAQLVGKHLESGRPKRPDIREQ